MWMGWQIYHLHEFGPVQVTLELGQLSRPRIESHHILLSEMLAPKSQVYTGKILTPKLWRVKNKVFIFRCRVDFRDAPSSNSFVNLNVIVQPKQVTIFDEKWAERNTFVGPYLEGENMNVICQAVGGAWSHLHQIYQQSTFLIQALHIFFIWNILDLF